MKLSRYEIAVVHNWWWLMREQWRKNFYCCWCGAKVFAPNYKGKNLPVDYEGRVYWACKKHWLIYSNSPLAKELRVGGTGEICLKKAHNGELLS